MNQRRKIHDLIGRDDQRLILERLSFVNEPRRVLLEPFVDRLAPTVRNGFLCQITSA